MDGQDRDLLRNRGQRLQESIERQPPCCRGLAKSTAQLIYHCIRKIYSTRPKTTPIDKTLEAPGSPGSFSAAPPRTLAGSFRSSPPHHWDLGQSRLAIRDDKGSKSFTLIGTKNCKLRQHTCNYHGKQAACEAATHQQSESRHLDDCTRVKH